MIIKELLTLPAILLTLISFGQSTNAPFKKSNAILIITEMEGNETFISWGKHLSQNGFSIDKSNKDFLTLTTGPKDTSKFNYDYIINSSINDTGTIILNVKWRLKSSILAGTTETEFYDWEYANGKNNVQNIIYRDIFPTIDSFGEYQIQYEKR